jgi:hypothetical protein
LKHLNNTLDHKKAVDDLEKKKAKKKVSLVWFIIPFILALTQLLAHDVNVNRQKKMAITNYLGLVSRARQLRRDRRRDHQMLRRRHKTLSTNLSFSLWIMQVFPIVLLSTKTFVKWLNLHWTPRRLSFWYITTFHFISSYYIRISLDQNHVRHVRLYNLKSVELKMAPFFGTHYFRVRIIDADLKTDTNHVLIIGSTVDWPTLMGV